MVARSKAFLEWAKRLGGECCICGYPTAVDLHHYGDDGGMGLKPSDYWVCRVCRKCHREVQGKRMHHMVRVGRLGHYCYMLKDNLTLLEGWVVKVGEADSTKQPSTGTNDTC